MAYLNLTERIFEGVAPYDIPKIEPVYDINVKDWISFNFIKGKKETIEDKNRGVDFYLSDHNFENVWTHPNYYIEKLKKYGVVLSPDFSLYYDFPKAVQIFNHYRKHWVAKYWQDHGIKVIPTIAWSDEDSFNWCFDGEPKSSIVSVSNVGCMRNENSRQAFLDGYNKMLEVLQPSKIIFFYAAKEEFYNGNVEFIKVDRFKSN